MSWTSVTTQTTTAWTGIAGPSSPVWNSILTQTTTIWASVANASDPVIFGTTGGEPIGLLMALTTDGAQTSIISSPWTDVDTQTITAWTSVLTSN